MKSGKRDLKRHTSRIFMVVLFFLVITPAFAVSFPNPAPKGTPIKNEIKINSWRRTDTQNFNNTTAEVCGVVTGTLTGQERVLLTVDSKGDPALYTVLLSPKGAFCQVVNSYTGQIQADLLNGSATTISSQMTHEQPKRF